MKFRNITLLLLLLLSYSAYSQYLEEQNALEAIYESRARQVLSAILSPKDFSVVVAVELDRDELKLKQFRESIDNQYLPGMPMMGEIPSSPQNNNRLHEMKSRVDINIILLKNLGPDVEKLVKDLVTTKLALDITGGDYVKVKRAAIVDDPITEVNNKPDYLPDLSWKMWFLVLILGLLVFAGLLFLAWRITNKKEDTPLVKEPNADSPLIAEVSPDIPSAEPALTHLPEAEAMMTLMPIAEIKAQISKMVEEIPDLMSSSLSEYIIKSSSLDVAYFMEHIGWEQGKIWFRAVPSLAWSRVGLALKEQSNNPRASDYTNAVQNVYKALLATYIEHEMGADESNPFGFVFQLSDSDLKLLLNKESSKNLAVLFLRSPSTLTSKLLSMLHNDKKVQCLAEMGKLEKISQDRFEVAHESLLNHVKKLKSPQEFSINGAGVLARVIREMNPEEEMQLLENLAVESPEEIEKIRTTILLFQDVILLPNHILSSYFESLSVDLLYLAYYKMPQKQIDKLMAYLPEKKAMVLERDLQEIPLVPSRLDIANVRRQIVLDLFSQLQKDGYSLDEIINGKIITLKSA